jgi:choline dehydrogenase
MIKQWDIVVVGGGAAGSVLASRLSEATNRSVLLIEAGPDLRAELPDDVRDGRRPTFDHDWGYSSEPDSQGFIRALYRGKLLGGCSSTNATFALRGHPVDYNGWAAAGNTGWSFANVLPYFCKLETDEDFGWTEWHGSSGPLPIRRYGDGELSDVALAGLETLEQCGFPRIPDANEPGAVGLARLPVNARAGERISTALAYLPPADSKPNLTIRCNAQVAELILQDARAVGVRLLSGEVIRASEVVVSAGTYASPALLMRSGIGHAAALRSLDIPVVADLPGVGQNLIDHPAVSVDLLYDRAVEPVPVFQVAATFHSSEADSGGAPDLQCMVGGPYVRLIRSHLRASIWAISEHLVILIGCSRDSNEYGKLLRSEQSRSCPGATSLRPTPKLICGLGCSERPGPTTTRSAPARWAWILQREPSSIRCAECTAYLDCASLTRRSCPTFHRRTPISRRS